LERHRVQFLVLEQILADLRTADLRMLHIAPEPFFREFFSKRFGRYETADLVMAGVDHKVDLRELPFENETYDLVFASHVLEHIRDDDRALAEIRRILRPNGMAILPVPIVAHETVEYPEPNPTEADLLPTKYQPFIYEDRTQWPTKESPLRPAMQGERHIDIVPVCYA
jgi:SAM-dependent methyltransferase